MLATNLKTLSEPALLHCSSQIKTARSQMRLQAGLPSTAQLQRAPFTSQHTAHTAAQRAFVQALRVVTIVLYYLSASSSDSPGKVCVVVGFRERLLCFWSLRCLFSWLCRILVAAHGKSLIFIVACEIFSCSIQTLSGGHAEFSFLTRDHYQEEKKKRSWNAAGDYGAQREDKKTAEGGFLRGLCLFRDQEEVRE